MDVGKRVTWREAVMTTNKAGQPVVAGERVITGTITRVRISEGGTTDYKIDVESVGGHDPTGIKASVWVKRQNLLKGRSWHCSKQPGGTRPSRRSKQRPHRPA